jgi:hypothetical protein
MMKSQKEYAKLEKDYEAMERNRKRYIYLFAILAMVAFGFSIYFLKEYINGTYSIFVFLSILTLSFVILGLMVLYIIRMYVVPKKMPLQKNMKEEYKNKNIRRSLSKLGLKDKNIDAFLDPHGYIVIIYDVNECVICKMKIGWRETSITLDLTDRFYGLDKKIFDKYLKGKYNKLSYYKNRKYDVDSIYNLFKKYIDDNEEKINVLRQSAFDAKNEHDERFGGSI